MAQVKDLLKFSLFMEDDFGLILAAEKLRQSSKNVKPKFIFENYCELRCFSDFRFHKADILRLSTALGIPTWMKTDNHGVWFCGIEGMCILLRRLAYPNRLIDLQVIFGRSKQILSSIFNTMLNYIYTNHHHLLDDINHKWLSSEYLKMYAEAITRKGSPLPGCIGFIDGTVHRICRPTKGQREVYSGHKRIHCLKYQSVVLPNGLIANLFGPIPGRRHDSFMLNQSKLLESLQHVIGADNYYLYGDSGYPLKRYLITPHLGTNLSESQLAFNATMSKLRIAVEWEFGKLYEQFAFLSFKYNQKLYLQPVCQYYKVATILKNCQTCLYGSQTSFYFNLPPPSLEDYINSRM